VVLGSRVLFMPAVIIIAVGFILEAGATIAVKAIKMSTQLARYQLGLDRQPGSLTARRGRPHSHRTWE
jgi:hypothetical protein